MAKNQQKINVFDWSVAQKVYARQIRVWQVEPAPYLVSPEILGQSDQKHDHQNQKTHFGGTFVPYKNYKIVDQSMKKQFLTFLNMPILCKIEF